eukprot:275260_1
MSISDERNIIETAVNNLILLLVLISLANKKTTATIIYIAIRSIVYSILKRIVSIILRATGGNILGIGLERYISGDISRFTIEPILTIEPTTEPTTEPTLQPISMN